VAALVLSSNTRLPRRAATDESLQRWRLADGKALAERAYALGTQRRIAEAIELCRKGYADAVRMRHPVASWWFLNSLGNAHYTMGAYRQALDEYLGARDTALKAGLQTEAATTLTNLSSLYFHVKDTSSALAAAEEAYRLLGNEGEAEQRSEILANLGRILLIRGDGARAVRIFREAIEIAFGSGDARTEAVAWDQMGTEFIRSGDLDRAEYALTRAFGLRRLNRDPLLFHTEYQLALLRLRQGDTRSARMLIEGVLSQPRRDPAQVPLHHGPRPDSSSGGGPEGLPARLFACDRRNGGMAQPRSVRGPVPDQRR
jgi:tetratricopeptide (TPR) repeat protein